MKGKKRVIIQNNRVHYEFVIKRNITIIQGDSASGKTTLVNLIARFWDVDSGSVRIGGIDVKDYKLDSLMKVLIGKLFWKTAGKASFS